KHMADEVGYDFKLVSAAMDINYQQQGALVNKARQHFDDKLAGKIFALWGLAFKPQTDDIRDAPALTIIDQLLAAGAKVRAYDPEAGDNIRQKYAGQKDLTIVDDKYQALKNAAALMIATEWPEFIEADLKQIKTNLK